MKTKIISSVLACFIAIGLSAQTGDRAKLESYFDLLEKNNKFMGNVMLSKDGKTEFARSVGYADLAQNKKLDINSRFRIGSISKMFTAAMIFKAVEAKKLSLSDKLSKFFSTIQNAEKISIEQLLGHRTGIHNFTDDDEYSKWEMVEKSKDDMLAIINSKPSDFEPGSKSEYSNSNYVLLSYILESVYKKPYNDLLQSQITKPLKLQNTYYGSKIDPEKYEARSYQTASPWNVMPETDMSIPTGAGAIVSTTTDLSRFIEALFSGKIISLANVDKMKTITDGYGLGMFRFPFGDRSGFGHTGGIDGFRSMLCYFPDTKVTYVILSNGVNYNTNDISLAVLSWFENKPYELPAMTAFAHSDDELAKFEGEYSSADMPLKITVTKKEKSLMVQATGQPSFFPDAIAKNQFKFDPAGLKINFKPDSNEMVVEQGGAVFNFKKV